MPYGKSQCLGNHRSDFSKGAYFLTFFFLVTITCSKEGLLPFGSSFVKETQFLSLAGMLLDRSFNSLRSFSMSYTPGYRIATNL